jgi:hypothetical protein
MVNIDLVAQEIDRNKAVLVVPATIITEILDSSSAGISGQSLMLGPTRNESR